MDIHRTEEEQVEAIKNWWKQNGASIVIGVVLGIAGIFGVRYWMDYQQAQREQASALYAQVLAVLQTDKAKAESLANQMKKDFSSTPYAALTALSLAKQRVEDKDIAGAKSYLQWVIDNSNNEGFQHVARIRLAQLLLTEDKTAEADALIKGVKAKGFDADYAELRGDIFASKGENTQAVENYHLAINELGKNSQRSQLLQMKIDDLTIAKSVK